jgi:hypothetical protein
MRSRHNPPFDKDLTGCDVDIVLNNLRHSGISLSRNTVHIQLQLRMLSSAMVPRIKRARCPSVILAGIFAMTFDVFRLLLVDARHGIAGHAVGM